MKKKKILIFSLSGVLAVLLILAIILLSVHFATRRNIAEFIECRIIELDDGYKQTVDKTNRYLGHPDLVESGGKLMSFYPSGHGKGAIIGKVSSDWGETWQDMTGLPESWKNSMETPCVYNLAKTDGTEVLVLTSGCPYWNDIKAMPDGFNSSVSYDGGETWSEFEHWYGQQWAENEFGDKNKAYDGIVAMSSLTQLKNSEGEYIDKWMGTFHRGANSYGMDAGKSYLNYRTYLTFEGERAVWSQPQPLFAESQHAFEELYGMCELEIIRNDSTENPCLILLARPNNRVSNALVSYSYDEGISWSDPKELPACFSGDRHKAEYDASTGKLVISFRQVLQKGNTYKESAVAAKNWMSAGWVAWVGDFDDLMSYSDDDVSNDTFGDGLIVLGKNYRRTDCGYSGVVILQDGTIILHSYGYFTKGVSYPYIMQVKFKLSDVL